MLFFKIPGVVRCLSLTVQHKKELNSIGLAYGLTNSTFFNLDGRKLVLGSKECSTHQHRRYLNRPVISEEGSEEMKRVLKFLNNYE